MIVAIEGLITQKMPGFVVLKLNNGISYGVQISFKTSAIVEKGEKREFLISQILREDSDNLYGFLETSEQRNFDMLRKLNGIGANTALAVCSSMSSDDFIKAVINGDITALTQVPGIGPKTARRIIAELSDAKLISLDTPQYQNETIMALESLGFKRDKILPILKTCEAQNTSDLVKEALQKLAKG